MLCERHLDVFALFFIDISCLYGIGASMGLAALPRPDLAAHRRSVQASFAEIVTELAEILGKKLTAYIGGVKDTRVVDRWSQGGIEPYRDAERRIRFAYQIAKTLSKHDSPRVVHAWCREAEPRTEVFLFVDGRGSRCGVAGRVPASHLDDVGSRCRFVGVPPACVWR